jgi:hypothetical protein
MQCPYNPKIQCEFLDTAGMDKPVECKDCPHYKQPDKDGIRATGATPFLAWLLNKWKYRKVKRANPSKLKHWMKSWVNYLLIGIKVYKKDGVSIIAKECVNSDVTCENCFFSPDGHNCNEIISEWNVPDCVYDYPVGHSAIYIIKEIQPPDPVMYECTCFHCGKKFSSSVPGFTCCPNCY